MWVEFGVGSRPCSEGFSPGSPVFLPPQKPTFLNSNAIGNLRATGLSVIYLFIYSFIHFFTYSFVRSFVRSEIEVSFVFHIIATGLPCGTTYNPKFF